MKRCGLKIPFCTRPRGLLPFRLILPQEAPRTGRGRSALPLHHRGLANQPVIAPRGKHCRNRVLPVRIETVGLSARTSVGLERFLDTEEVDGSSPFGPTTYPIESAARRAAGRPGFEHSCHHLPSNLRVFRPPCVAALEWVGYRLRAWWTSWSGLAVPAHLGESRLQPGTTWRGSARIPSR